MPDSSFLLQNNVEFCQTMNDCKLFQKLSIVYIKFTKLILQYFLLSFSVKTLQKWNVNKGQDFRYSLAGFDKFW